jgi:LuxR family transcriptional regulator, maltose regulon positive regulatory protein
MEQSVEPGGSDGSVTMQPPLRLIDRVPREPLVHWLSYRLTLIVAAAGYGKTTLARQMVGFCGLPAAWYQPAGAVDEVQLVSGLVQALAPQLAFDGELVISRIRDARDSAAAWHGLQQALAAAAQPLVIVIDDCHEFSEPLVQLLFSRLVQRTPPQVHWLLLARRPLPVALSRMRLNGELLEIGVNELRLTHDEIAVYLHSHGVTAPSDALIEQLAATSGGWIAGLRLLLLGLTADGVRDAVRLRQDAEAEVSAYFHEEVLSLLPAEWRDFLLQIAFLPRFGPALADVVSGRSDSARLIERLWAERLFLQRDDRDTRSYQLHQLLRETLRHEAALQLSAAQRQAAVQRAAAWLTADGQLFAAVELLCAEGMPRDAAALLGEHARPLLASNEAYELERLLALIPPALINSDGVLLLTQVWVQFARSDFAGLHAALPRLQLLRPTLDRVSRDEVTALELLAAYLAMQNEGLWQRADAVLAALDGHSALARGWIALTAALSYRDPDDRLTGCVRYLNSALAAFRQADAVLGEAAVYGLQCMLLLQQAAFNECLFFCDAAIAYTQRLKQRAVALDLHLQTLKPLTEVHYLRNETAAAVAGLQQWSRLAAVLQQPLLQLQAEVRAALCGPIEQESAAGRRLVGTVLQQLTDPEQQARPAAEQLQLIFDTMRLAVRCAALSALPQLLTAARIGTAAPSADSPQLVWLLHCYPVTYAATGDDDPTELLETGIRHSARSGSRYLELWLHSLLALLQYRRGRHAAARTTLRLLLPQIERSGAVRIILDQAALLPLLQALDTRFARRLMQQLTAATAGNGSAFSSWEARIVPLLAADWPTAAIAAEIGVSVSTVRYHLTAIYRKLGVAGRAAAVARFRESAAADAES